jgi:class 3 adenylate cyclase
MVKGGDLFGDSVNIAARLQTLASAGGVCLSGVAHDQVRKILPSPSLILARNRSRTSMSRFELLPWCLSEQR